MNVCKEFDGFQVEADLTGSVQGTVDLQIRIKGSEKGDLIPQVKFTLSEQKNQRLLEELVRYGEVFTHEGIDYQRNIRALPLIFEF